MPIQLPPLSRRQFLRRAAALGAGLALTPRLQAAPKPLDVNSWALFSDLHLAADRSASSRGVNMADHFAAVVRELLGRESRPAGVVITGDCAYNAGQAGDYAVLADLLTPVREGQMPVHLLLGNHDNRERFWEAFQEEKISPRPVADKQVALLRTDRANWFMLDSLEQTSSTPGLLGRAQLAWLEKTLDANPDKPALILVHHNAGIDGNMGLKDTVALFEILRPRLQVKAFIYGHTHVWKTEQETSGIHLINLPPVAYVFQNGNPSGWVYGTLQPNGLDLELRCIDTAHKAHGQKVKLEWRKG